MTSPFNKKLLIILRKTLEINLPGITLWKYIKNTANDIILQTHYLSFLEFTANDLNNKFFLNFLQLNDRNNKIPPKITFWL